MPVASDTFRSLFSIDLMLSFQPMPKHLFLVAAALFCVGCPVVERPCDPLADRGGVFAASFDEIPGGTCGPVPDLDVPLDGFPGLTCVDASEPAERECLVTRQLECANGNGMRVTVESASRSGGDGFSGLQTVTQYTFDGAELCRSSYLVTYVHH